MHRLIIDIDDEAVMDKVIHFLNRLPQKKIKIVKKVSRICYQTLI